MQKYYVVTMSDGRKWGVPAEVIAKNRAEYYEKIDPDTTFQEEFDAMMEWFDNKDYEFADWAKGNMNWADVEADAILIEEAKPSKIDWEDCWMNGGYEYRHLEECTETAKISDTPIFKKCPACGTEHNNNYDACHRCMGLARLMGGRMSVEDLVSKIWQQCPKCYAEFICDAKLQGDDFVITCDGCGETICMPFSGDDIFRYIQTGIWSDLEDS